MIEAIRNINNAIERSLCDIDLQAYGLAESVAVRSDDEVTFPALVLPTSECISVYGETDKHDVTFYHRLNDIAYNEDTTASYGSVKAYQEVADMSLIVFGKRSAISPFEMEQVCRAAIATEKNSTLVRSDFNALQIFASEYVGVTYFMGSAYFIFKINYRITSTYNPRCN